LSSDASSKSATSRRLVRAGDDNRLTRDPFDGSQAVTAGPLGRGWIHHLLPDRPPHRAQGGIPADVEFVGVSEDLARVQAIVGVFNCLLLSAHSDLDW
jgi:hypothetical protein